MSLMVGLTLRLVAVALACLALAAGWVVVDAGRQIRGETAASADRIVRLIGWQPWLGSADRSQRQLYSERQALALVKVVGPGVCIELTPAVGPDQRVCSGWEGLGATPPRWFAALFARLFDPGPPIRRTLRTNDEGEQSIVASADPVAATTRAWQQVRIVVGMAAAMAAGMALLAFLAVGHALLPAQAIVRGLKRLGDGDFAARLPRFRVAEFDAIAAAVDALAGRIERVTAERTALTRRLFEVQEEERRGLARELHDEFGQCLTATGALAAALQAGIPPERPDLAEDARAIARITAGMMATLKGALMRLRPPDLDEIGLDASLRTMVAGWNAVAGGRTRFRLVVAGDLSGVPPATAVEVYRIAQECLTNAARHGRPNRVTVAVDRTASDAIDLVVEDDGGGDPGRLSETPGFGLLGIRERVAALGGRLAIGRARGGVRVAVHIPPARAFALRPPPPAPADASGALLAAAP